MKRCMIVNGRMERCKIINGRMARCKIVSGKVRLVSSTFDIHLQLEQLHQLRFLPICCIWQPLDCRCKQKPGFGICAISIWRIASVNLFPCNLNKLFGEIFYHHGCLRESFNNLSHRKFPLGGYPPIPPSPPCPRGHSGQYFPEKFGTFFCPA